MIKIDADKYLLELTFNCLDKEDGDDWWDYDVYLFDKIDNKIVFSTKDNLFHELTYNHMELHYEYDLSVIFVWLDKILDNYDRTILCDSCESEFGFEYIPTDYNTFEFKFILFEQRLCEDKIVFNKTYTREELIDLRNRFEYEYKQHTIRMKSKND